MKARWAILALAIVVGAGCAHTKSTDKGGAESDRDGGSEEAKATKPEPTGGGTHGAGEQAGRKSGSVPLATSPAGLLAPGAEKKIRERLSADGFLARDADSDAAMREGLRRFQHAKDLPATGVADQETVRKLGLDPDEIFRKASVKD